MREDNCKTVRTGVTGMDPDLPRGRSEAVAKRESLPPAERERTEATVAELLSLLGKAHAVGILRTFALSPGAWRFSELEAELGVSPNTLSERLTELVVAGLLTRTSYDEIPPRVEYEATEAAAALFPALGHVHRWALDHDLTPAGEDAVAPDEDD
jgi:DNA-binding HxlR family transcriptional regulator